MVGRLDSKEALISVIVPVYNGQDYLENCVRSIESQSYKNLEVIIINDGSKDNTAGVCSVLQEAYDNVRVIMTNDLGVSAARNAGLDEAKGEFITFVDADDRLRPGVLRGLHELLLATDSDMAGCGFACWGTFGEWEELAAEGEMPRKLTGQQTAVTYNNSTCYLKESLLQGNVRCWSKLYRRNLIGPVRFREGLTVGEDMLFLMELLPRMRQAVETAYPGYGYYRNPGGVMQRPFTPAYMDQIYCWEMAGELIVRQEASLAPQADAQIMVGIMLTVGKLALLSAKERKEAGEYLRVCHRKLRELAKEKACYAYLPSGYGIKVRMFTLLPELYVRLYHVLQQAKNR